MRSIRRREPGWLRLLLSVILSAASCTPPPRTPRYVGAGKTGPRHGGRFVFYAESNVRHLDPHLAYDELSLMAIRLLFDGLLDYNHKAELIPSLARQVPQAELGGRFYRFELQRGVRFHHGRELTAEDVRWSMEHMLHPKTGSPGFTFFSHLVGLQAFRQGKARHIRGIQVLDRYQVSFRLKQPDQTFLNAMAMSFAYPVPRENYRGAGERAQRRPWGTGPYRLSTWERGVRLTFRRNRQYWRAPKPYIEAMVFFENLSRDVALMRFQNGEIEHASRFTPADLLYFRHAKAWTPYRAEPVEANIWGLVMNCEIPPFDNVHVRRAVALAIDRERWSRARSGRLRVTGQPIPPGIMGYHAQLPGRQRFDLRAARAELARARAELTRGGRGGELQREIVLWIGEGPTGRFFGELAQADLARLGLKVRLKAVAFAVYLQESGKRRRVPMMISGWSQDFPDPADFLDILFHSDAIHPENSENRSFYKNPKLDALLDRARVELDKETRRRLYEEASSLVARDAPWAFLWNSLGFELWQPYVRGYRPHPVWSGDFRFAWLDLPKKPWRAGR